MDVYAFQPYDSAKLSDTAHIQHFQPNSLQTISDASFYISNFILHNDLKLCMKSSTQKPIGFSITVNQTKNLNTTKEAS